MEEMITLYSMDRDGIALVHYCPTNNQPRMRVVPSSTDVKELSFDYQGAGNLKSPETGHQHHLVLRFEDDNHITETWTWREGDKDTPMVFHLTRKAKQFPYPLQSETSRLSPTSQLSSPASSFHAGRNRCPWPPCLNIP